MTDQQPKNPLHGVKLEQVVTDLVDTFGWPVLAEQVNVNCFRSNPTVKSSLKFLRKTPWAREKVESLYVYAIIRGKPLKSQEDYKANSGRSSSSQASPSATPSAKPAATKASGPQNSHIWKS